MIFGKYTRELTSEKLSEIVSVSLKSKSQTILPDFGKINKDNQFYNKPTQLSSLLAS
ncbi:hypothetical protein QNI16_36290 [Cytophagaceae bacterium YF14B1]|uniref:Uncharacterized protein n=1 Tax=Xanthocytophaga flava TaxID=3048013 RepID=A0AAE3QYX4_9BACT|nr:hypothetical protein [Xanthocytophaga flavus]MDJ1485998.1 hypothetical protein [Xanthocytophaga flavus]